MADEYIGQVLDGWELVRPIGSGSMGDVYLARRKQQVVHQTVAVKILRREPSAGSVDEAAILRGLRHRNIARRFEDGLTPSGRRYIVMEYVDGPPITDYADQKGLSIPSRLQLFLEACDAIEYVHNRTLLHMDIKPGNLLVNSDGVVKAIDFGIARQLRNKPETGTADAFSGPYASPEQIQAGAALGFVTDIYSLGAVLYELLCGHPPFKSGISDRELDRYIVENIPRAPSQALMQTKLVALPSGGQFAIEPDRLARMRDSDPYDLRKALRGDLDRICLFALRKNPAQRYRSVADLIADVRSVLNGGHPAIARSGNPAYSVISAARRKPLVALAGVLVLATAFSGALYPRAFRQGTEESRDRTNQINRAADATLDELRRQLRPQLANDPRRRLPLSILDATLRAAGPVPPVLNPWEDIWKQWIDLNRNLLKENRR